jgi:hypothetical protein
LFRFTPISSPAAKALEIRLRDTPAMVAAFAGDRGMINSFVNSYAQL